jgi:hypothetical protein
MSRTIALATLAIIVVFISSDRTLRAAAPTTQPDLAAENTMLKKIIAEDMIKNDQLLSKLRDAEDRNAELQAKIKELQQRLASHNQTSPLLPYYIQPLNPWAPRQDSNAGSFNFNGKTVYVVPLHDDTLSIYPTPWTATSSIPGNSGVYQLRKGNLIDDRSKP